MKHGLWVGCCVLAVGCSQTVSHYTPPPEQIPAPIEVAGATIVIDDQRPDWERQPFTGPLSLFHLGRVKPSPWMLLARETEAVIAALPEKPARVNVTVVSFRLVKRDDGAMRAQEAAIRKARMPDDPTSEDPSFAARWNYDQARNAQQAGDVRSANSATQALVGNAARQAVATPLTFGTVWHKYPPALDEHPPGASCELMAVIQLIDANGNARHVSVRGVGSGQNTSGTAYWGEALEFAARLAVTNYGRQLREGLGLPPDG